MKLERGILDIEKGLQMLIDRKVAGYVRAVTNQVPLRDRGRVDRELTDLIYEMMKEYAGGKEPDILDCRDVLRDLGTPEEVAAAYIETKQSGKKPGRTREFLASRSGRMLRLVYTILTVLAVCLVAFGLIGLGTQTISTMLPIFLGVVIALMIVLMRSVLTTMELQEL